MFRATCRGTPRRAGTRGGGAAETKPTPLKPYTLLEPSKTLLKPIKTILKPSKTLLKPIKTILKPY